MQWVSDRRAIPSRNVRHASYVQVSKMFALKKTSTPPPPPRFPGLEDLDRPELDDEHPFYEDEDDTLRCPVPDWSDESGVKKVGSPARSA
jgi:hypothetical protein